MIGLVPLSYFDPLGVRVVALSALLFFVISIFSIKRAIYIDKNLLLFIPSLLTVLVFSSISGSKDVVSAIVFMSYLLPLNFFNYTRVRSIFKKSIFLYIVGALFMAVGVIVQRILFEKFGYEFGKIDFYGGNRIGFGFLWMDYSFLSLYLLTALPMVFYFFKGMQIKVIICATLLVGSVVTTARTGLAALIITSVFVMSFEFFKATIKAKITKKKLLVLCLFILASFLVVYFYVRFSSREVGFGGSGRLIGYYLALQSFFDNPILGVMFDRGYYLSNYGTIPHNLFIYILSQGGIFFFVLFFLWFSYVLYVATFKVEVLRYPVIIAFFGFMFIPSFYSAYFFALLVSFTMAERRLLVVGHER